MSRPGPRPSDLIEDPAVLRSVALEAFDRSVESWMRRRRSGKPCGKEPRWPVDPLLEGFEFAVRARVIAPQNRKAIEKGLLELDALLGAAPRPARGPSPDLTTARRFWLSREVAARARRARDGGGLASARQRVAAPEIARAHRLMFDEPLSEDAVRQRRRRFKALVGTDPWLPRERG